MGLTGTSVFNEGSFNIYLLINFFSFLTENNSEKLSIKKTYIRKKLILFVNKISPLHSSSSLTNVLRIKFCITILNFLKRTTNYFSL